MVAFPVNHDSVILLADLLTPPPHFFNEGTRRVIGCEGNTARFESLFYLKGCPKGRNDDNIIRH